MLKKIILSSLITILLSSCNNTTTIIIPEEPVKDSVVVKFLNHHHDFSINDYTDALCCPLNTWSTSETLFVKIPFNSYIIYTRYNVKYTIVGIKDSVVN
jgi:hypothetical protein